MTVTIYMHAKFDLHLLKLTQLKTTNIHIRFHNLAETLLLKDASSVLFVILH